ncbi:MAG TPA: helix-turn-helix transcriptional regulator [Stellaceae bacterium]|jgi:transcriptional regulator with XRE-family HTH domain
MPRRDGAAQQYLDLAVPRVARALEAARRRKDWTKRDLGRAAGVSETQVAKLLDAKTFGEPQLATMVRVARALGLSLDGLFGIPADATPIPEQEDPIAYILVRRQWTAHQLGAAAGLSHGTVPQIVAGKSRPDLFTACALARAGGVSLASLAAAFLD